MKELIKIGLVVLVALVLYNVVLVRQFPALGNLEEEL
jgi:hypothetical protein